ncbi:hypothetical protein EF294_20175 [Gordonia oryzae]|uniref:Uncharacterized protein n=2 Tax=Gordonia oryzae TaxID=2487349 RepID=A0A3N4GD39_9ACTN|nr:hypothetical protein EF294_20175 [Gordonia oryzae]
MAAGAAVITCAGAAWLGLVAPAHAWTTGTAHGGSGTMSGNTVTLFGVNNSPLAGGQGQCSALVYPFSALGALEQAAQVGTQRAAARVQNQGPQVDSLNNQYDQDMSGVGTPLAVADTVAVGSAPTTLLTYQGTAAQYAGYVVCSSTAGQSSDEDYTAFPVSASASAAPTAPTPSTAGHTDTDDILNSASSWMTWLWVCTQSGTANCGNAPALPGVTH